MRIGIGYAAAVAAFLLFSAVPTRGEAEQTQPESYVVKVNLVGSDNAPIQHAFMELRPAGRNDGIRVSGDSSGRIVASTPAGKYDLTIEAGGFNNLSRTITITRDVDLGRIVMDPDPNVVYAGSASICCFDPLESSPKKDEPQTVAAGINPVLFRGRIEPASDFNGSRLHVQVSCSEQQPGVPQRPQIDVVRVPLDSSGAFESDVPLCFSDRLAHRELRFSLKNEDGATVALLLPKMTADGYNQSRFGVLLPLKPIIPDLPNNEATLGLEFTDNRPLHATISVVQKNPIGFGGSVFLSATLTNTSDEVLAISSQEFVSDYAWIISDNHGKRVPFHLFMDRTGEPPDQKEPRSRFLFPGEGETDEVNISLLFTFSSPGTYHVVAKRVVRRPEVLGEAQLTSPETTFVISPSKNGRLE